MNPAKPFKNQPLAIIGRSVPVLGALVAAAVVATTPMPAAAQDNAEARLRKAEAEIRALQRAVFPGGDGRFFEPQITANGTATGPTVSTAPSTTAVTDILARLDALELQLQRLTARSEETTNTIAGLEARVVALETAAAATPVVVEEEVRSATDMGPAAVTSRTPATAPAQQTAPAATGPSAERVAAVQAIAKPQTEDAGDDEYSYGFRLWNAGFYPEARQQLAAFVEQYPNHSRLTFGRNLLGRAFLDDGMPEEAARWFLRNYQADRTAARAPDSLLFLAEAMIAMDDTRRACIALAEFGDTYPAIASGRLADQYASNLAKVTCQ
ncbi:hypothetical protein MACH24_10440 [Erythrobacter sp. Dej080120_24]|uniref:tetratricopeptide repeat protein n=1 Tax=Erythrobacter sp. Dej080120_24 TaxID=3024837 RepID=UPI002921DBEA|nr:hypothetical protein MACH24_10440 [Erythrobacter sp. Dej080120_24]